MYYFCRHMNLKIFLFIVAAVVLLSSCEKSIQEDAYEVYQLQMVRQGSHYHDDHTVLDITSFTSSIFSVSVKLDTSLFVTNEGSFQSKLVGFYEDQIHQNSARVSYQTITNDVQGELIDSLSFKTYVYNNGLRSLDENYTLLTLSRIQVEKLLKNDEAIEINIELTPTQYLFQVNDGEITAVTHTCNLAPDACKYLTYHYYGGPDSIPAPHDMKLWVKYNDVMK